MPVPWTALAGGLGKGVDLHTFLGFMQELAHHNLEELRWILACHRQPPRAAVVAATAAQQQWQQQQQQQQPNLPYLLCK